MHKHIKAEVAGEFRLVAVNAETGESRVLADWFPNLITNSGLNAIGTQGVLTHKAVVGSGQNPPNVLDTQLQSQVAQSDGFVGGRQAGVSSTSPYNGWEQYTYRFSMGLAQGNLSEVGILMPAPASTVFSRTLIKDANGDPTTVTVLANEFLDVTYRLYIYPSEVDVVSIANLDGTDHSVTLRACEVTNGAYWHPRASSQPATFDHGQTQTPYIYSGDIGTITQSPSGSAVFVVPVTNVYVNNSLERTGYMELELTQGNFGGGVKSIRFCSTLGAYQASFEPPLPKTNLNTLRINFKISWARRA